MGATTAFVDEPYATSGVVGSNFNVRTTEPMFRAGTTTVGTDNTKWVYGTAGAVLAAGDRIDLDGSFTATAGETYISPYAVASGQWAWFKEASSDSVVIPFYAVSANGADAAVVTLVAPFDFRISKIDTVLLGGALTTGNATVTAAIAGTGVTGGVVTITQSGSAAGDKDSAVPTALNTGASGATITLTVGGTAAGSRTLNGFVTLERV